jgi:hypothetical protein
MRTSPIIPRYRIIRAVVAVKRPRRVGVTCRVSGIRIAAAKTAPILRRSQPGGGDDNDEGKCRGTSEDSRIHDRAHVIGEQPFAQSSVKPVGQGLFPGLPACGRQIFSTVDLHSVSFGQSTRSLKKRRTHCNRNITSCCRPDTTPAILIEFIVPRGEYIGAANPRQLPCGSSAV